MILDRCADWLEKEIVYTQELGVADMMRIIEKLPVGWSIVEERNGWNIYDDDGELVCTGQDTEQLHRVLNVEFALAQAFAAWMHAYKQTEAAEA
jgi:hypothetical protein